MKTRMKNILGALLLAFAVGTCLLLIDQAQEIQLEQTVITIEPTMEKPLSVYP